MSKKDYSAYLDRSLSLAQLLDLGVFQGKYCNRRIARKLLNLTRDDDPIFSEVYFYGLAAKATRNPMVLVQGGVLPESSELDGMKVGAFQIGKSAVTLEDWRYVWSWACDNGFRFAEGTGRGPRHPVTEVNWCDCVIFCNAKSLMEGLESVYYLGTLPLPCSALESARHKEVVLKSGANGYRLPAEAEWEWAARGGRNSQGYAFAGSNNLSDAGWFADNSFKHTQLVGCKEPNELGIYDMSGNVNEWCWDLNGSNRRYRGGSYAGSIDTCALSYRGKVENGQPDDRAANFGLRLARNA